MLLKRDPLVRVNILNFIAEFFASAMFSLLYFIFISRYLSEEFNISSVMLAFAIGLSFFVSVFVPFHTYRIHIIPFISIINALRKKRLRVVLYKIPAQALGALLGVAIFKIININTTEVDIFELKIFNFSDNSLVAILNAIVGGTLCYGFYAIRHLFKFQRLTGTILLGVLMSGLFYLTAPINGITALNPFGHLFYSLFKLREVDTSVIPLCFIVHVVAPVAAAIFVFYFFKDRLLKSNNIEFK